MGMYIMNGKTFLKSYIFEEPDVVLNTQFILVSSLIRKAGRYEEQIINANGFLYPGNMMIVDYTDYKDPDYEARYFDQLNNAKPFLATVIQFCLDSADNIVFLCAQKEWDYRYLKLIQKFVLEEFGFHIYDYKKLKAGKEKQVEDDDSAVSSICRKILEKAKKEQKDRQLSTEKGRDEYVTKLEKSEMIKKLKKRNLYAKGMSKAEMIDTLKTFL